MINKTIKGKHLDMSNTKAKERIWIKFFIKKNDIRYAVHAYFFIEGHSYEYFKQLNIICMLF